MTDSLPVWLIDPSTVRDLAPEVLDENGRLKVMPGAFWAQTTRAERGLFGVKHGIYSFPTTELVHYLTNLIDGRRAIEIGAGHGVLAEALGIPGTDSYQQILPKYREIYRLAGQAIVPYGPNVEHLDAMQAISKYKPAVVIGCWVTHKYNPKHHRAGGNEVGVDEAKVLRRVDTYVAIGNQKVHEDKFIWSLPHDKTYPSWLYSRAMNGSRDFIAIWPKRD